MFFLIPSTLRSSRHYMVTLVAYAARLGFGQINERTDCCLHNPPRKSYANPPKQPHAVATVMSVGINRISETPPAAAPLPTLRGTALRRCRSAGGTRPGRHRWLS